MSGKAAGLPEREDGAPLDALGDEKFVELDEDAPFPLEESMIVGAPGAVPAKESPPVNETSSQGAPRADHLLETGSAAAAASAFGNLRRTLAERHAGLGQGAATIEDLVREELRPLLKDWLDRHLPDLVERVVRAEVQRLAGPG